MQVWLEVSQTLPLVASPQSLSATHCTQVPAVVSAEVHTWVASQPLPPGPRQPSTQVLLVASQIMPLVAPPQSVSMLQPTH